jgi:predicted Rossmann fold flavoprotein
MSENIWDVIVVGGGPAGMMTAGRAGELGAKVLLLEKNNSLGKKLLITGGGRCNVTNAEPDVRKFLEKYKNNSKFLFSAFSQLDVKKTLDFFHNRKMDTKIENEGRVFPVSNSAQSVWDVLVEYMRTSNITLRSDCFVTEILKEKENVIGVKIKNGEEIYGRSIVIATGGTSRPETGSTGDGYKWLRKIGHTVIEPTPSLVPIAVKNKWISRLAGISMSDVKITTFQNNEKQSTSKGKILFTHVGLSGPAILNMSSEIGELLKYGEVTISLDLLPKLDHGQLNTKLQEIFKENANKKFKNSIGELTPSALAPTIVELSKIDPEIKCNGVTREERIKLIEILKGLKIEVSGLLGTDKAIITSGGVTLDEVDFKTMQSRLFSNLYLVGDILNIDRPSGGYSLQLCWTTGFVAGTNVAKKI